MIQPSGPASPPEARARWRAEWLAELHVATVLAVLAAVLWILHSDDRTRRLAALIRSVRGPR